MQLSAVLSHAAVSGLDKSKLDLNDSERVLDLGTDSGLERLKPIGDAVLGGVSQRASPSRPHGNVPGGFGLGAPLDPTVASICKDGVLFSGEKFFDRRKVVYIATRRLKTPASFYSQ